MGEMRIMGSDGDQRVIWDVSKDIEVEAAEETFVGK